MIDGVESGQKSDGDFGLEAGGIDGGLRFQVLRLGVELPCD